MSFGVFWVNIRIKKLFLDTDFGNDFFLDLTWKAQEKQAKVNKGDYIKLKSFCIAKEQSI